MKRLRVAVLGVFAASLFGQVPAVAADGQCRVVIDRSQAPGTFDVTRQTDEDSCICYAYTGPETQGAATEARISRLLESKSCPDAKAMALAKQCSTASGGSCSGAGALGFFGAGGAPLIVGLGVAGIAAVAASSGSEEATPTSP